MTEIADILDKAADTLETRGWFQGTWYQGYNDRVTPADGCEVCALAAINAVDGVHLDEQFTPGLRRDAALALAVEVGIDIPTEFDEDDWDGTADTWNAQVADHITTDVGNWNDEDGRTRDEVVAALRAAATKARETGA